MPDSQAAELASKAETACRRRDTTVEKFDVSDVFGDVLRSSMLSAILQYNGINYLKAGNKLSTSLCNQAYGSEGLYWVPGFEVIGFGVLCAQ